MESCAHMVGITMGKIVHTHDSSEAEGEERVNGVNERFAVVKRRAENVGRLLSNAPLLLW